MHNNFITCNKKNCNNAQRSKQSCIDLWAKLRCNIAFGVVGPKGSETQKATAAKTSWPLWEGWVEALHVVPA